MKLKQFLSAALIAAMSISFAACGDDEPDNPNDKPNNGNENVTPDKPSQNMICRLSYIINLSDDYFEVCDIEASYMKADGSKESVTLKKGKPVDVTLPGDALQIYDGKITRVLDVNEIFPADKLPEKYSYTLELRCKFKNIEDIDPERVYNFYEGMGAFVDTKLDDYSAWPSINRLSSTGYFSAKGDKLIQAIREGHFDLNSTITTSND